MANIIQQKRSAVAGVVPTAAQLAVGEIAVNTADGKVYTLNSAGEVVELTIPTVADGGEIFTDPDAQHWVDGVYAAGSSVDPAVATAVNNFVIGCKTDGIWGALKSSCILAGANTLAGALVPLTGVAPTNFNFVEADYNPVTGLKGNGSNKYLDSNRAGNADPQDSVHLAAWVSAPQSSTSGGIYLGSGGFNIAGGSNVGAAATTRNSFFRSRSSAIQEIPGTAAATGFVGMSRSAAASYSYRSGAAFGTVSQASQPQVGANYFVFSRNVNGSPQLSTDGRLAFYSIGESLDLALLDARVTQLMADITAALA